MPVELIIGGVILFIGGAVQGCMGFGLALTAVPVLMLVLPHTLIPPVLVILGVVNNLMVLAGAWRAVRLKTIYPLIAGGLIGLPIGAYLLKTLDSGLFKIGVGVIVLVAAVAMLRGWQLRLRHDWPRLAPVGLLSGVLGGATALSGPPVILLFAGNNEDKQGFRGNLIGYFTLLNIGSILVFGASGLLTMDVLRTALWFLAPLLLGSAAGVWIAHHVSEHHFRTAVLVLIICIGLSLVVTNIPQR